MNVFYIASDPVEAGRMHCDQHVGKMLIETSQMMSTAHRMLNNNTYADTAGLYRSTHANHPSCQWVRSSTLHYLWALRLACALSSEFRDRYGKSHKTSTLLSKLAHVPPKMPRDGFRPPPQCFGDANSDLMQPDTVAAYRAYYRRKGFPKWSKSKTPEWYLSN